MAFGKSDTAVFLAARSACAEHNRFKCFSIRLFRLLILLIDSKLCGSLANNVISFAFK